jgi:Rrf2 family protein
LALKLMIELARAETAPSPALSASALAARCRASVKFVEQVLIDLQTGGFIVSSRGRFGGRRLARSADQITLGQINRHMDGPLAPAPCASLTRHRTCDWCQDEATCDLRPVWVRVRDSIAAVMDSVSLADVVRESASRQTGRYAI